MFLYRRSCTLSDVAIKLLGKLSLVTFGVSPGTAPEAVISANVSRLGRVLCGCIDIAWMGREA